MLSGSPGAGQINGLPAGRMGNQLRRGFTLPATLRPVTDTAGTEGTVAATGDTVASAVTEDSAEVSGDMAGAVYTVAIIIPFTAALDSTIPSTTRFITRASIAGSSFLTKRFRFRADV